MTTTATTTNTSPVQSRTEAPITYDINIPYKPATGDEHAKLVESTRYPAYLPNWDPIWFDPFPGFDFSDPALRADKAKPNLLKSGVTASHITPRMGTTLHGVQLSKLSDEAKDELALLVSERKIVALHDQDFVDAGPDFQQKFMDYFGKRNYQPVSGSIKGYPGFHVIHRNGNKGEIDAFMSKKTTSTLWHQDVSYERQPPGYVMLGLLEGPEVGGDTVFADTAMAYRRLSPVMQSIIDKLKATHSSANMIQHTKALGGLVRKDPIQSLHPVVRVHPVTGEKCIFVNGEFITGFDGMKDVEWRTLLDFLLDHIISSHDIQARVSWKPRTVVIFDNRSTLHTAVVDYMNDENGAQPRHIFRLASMAEMPVPAHA